MKEELEKEIISIAPHMFKGYHKTPEESCLAFGMECGDGWGKLLKELFTKLAKLDKDHIIAITQIKEKFGWLRVYFMTTEEDKYNIYDKVDDLITKYEHKSMKICEVCGKPGKLNRDGWITCLCKKCRSNQHKKRLEDLDKIKGK